MTLQTDSTSPASGMYTCHFLSTNSSHPVYTHHSLCQFIQFIHSALKSKSLIRRGLAGQKSGCHSVAGRLFHTFVSANDKLLSFTLLMFEWLSFRALDYHYRFKTRNRLAIGDRPFCVTVARAWNSLPTNVTASTSLPSFKRQNIFIYEIFPITLNCFL